MSQTAIHNSGIGGQAVLEGVMTRSRNMMAIAVRDSLGEIQVEVEEHHAIGEGTVWSRIPVIRGVLAFIDSIIVGVKGLSLSTDIYMRQEEEMEEDSGRRNSIFSGIAVAFAFILGLCLFIVLPYSLRHLINVWVRSAAIRSLIGGGIWVGMLILFMLILSRTRDVRRLHEYHGAQHKCVSCIERGKPLTVGFVRQSSRFHGRCATSGMLLVLFISIILFFFIQVSDPFLRIFVRVAVVPLTAGIVYEVLQLAGRSSTVLSRVLSAPDRFMQRYTTREPDDEMIETSIAAMEAVYDWRAYLCREFGYSMEDLQDY